MSGLLGNYYIKHRDLILLLLNITSVPTTKCLMNQCIYIKNHCLKEQNHYREGIPYCSVASLKAANAVDARLLVVAFSRLYCEIPNCHWNNNVVHLTTANITFEINMQVLFNFLREIHSKSTLLKGSG